MRPTARFDAGEVVDVALGEHRPREAWNSASHRELAASSEETWAYSWRDWPSQQVNERTLLVSKFEAHCVRVKKPSADKDEFRVLIQIFRRPSRLVERR
jgi:hypothetical protein